MPFDSVVLAAVASEIRECAGRTQVVKIYQPSPLEIVIHLRAGGERRALYLSAHPERFGLHFVRDVPENPPAPPQFCMVLRKHLEGAKLVAADQDGLERVLRLRFSRSDGERDLVAEMMGKHSNVLLVDDDGTILDAIKHVSGRVNRFREALPGRLYLPPPPQDRPDPIKASESEIRDSLNASGPTGPQALVKTFANIGPFLAREILARAGSDGPEACASAIVSMMERARECAFAPTLLLDDTGRPTDAWAFECLTWTPECQSPADTLSRALESSGRAAGDSQDIERLRGEVRARLESLRDREERLLADLAVALDAAEKREEYRIKGELIQGNAHAIRRGQTVAEVPNYYDPNQALLRIELDPTLSPQENADSYFRRHRKAKSSLPVLVERAADAQRKRDEWVLLVEEVAAADAERLRAIRSMTERTTPADGVGGKAQEAERRPGPGVRRALSSDGYEIWYGENQEGNDVLTSRLAAPTDLWLHVRAAASAHVVIRARKKPEEVPQRTLMEAARIAAAHSESKHSEITPVDYTLKKHVRKPRGSGPGKALYTHERTLHVRSASEK